MESEETITIPKTEYEQLKAQSDWLGYLVAAGVDNWQGIDFAYELRAQEEKINNE